MAAIITDNIEETEFLVRLWETAPPVPPRHPLRTSYLQDPFIDDLPPALPQKNPRRLSLDLRNLPGIIVPRSPYASSSVYSEEPPSPITESSEAATVTSAAASTISASSQSSRSTLSRRLPAKTIEDLKARLDELRPQLDEFKSRVDEFKVKTDTMFSSGREHIRILRDYGGTQNFRWQPEEFC